MRRLLTAAAALAGVLAAAPAASAAPYVVTLADGASVDAVVREARLPAPTLTYDAALTGFAADLSGPQLDRLLGDPAVTAVEPDVEVSAMGMEALAAGETVPPGIRRTGGATPALAHAPATTAVAVIDSGIDLANPELDAVSGTNCVKPGTPAQDDNGHGTNVAGIIAARNTGDGLVGVAPGTRVYAVKVLNNRAVGTLSQFLCGINWVAANAAALDIRTANMSIGGVGLSDGACGTVSGDSEHKAICAATAAGVTFVVSAGNGGTDFKTTVPAAYPEVLTATAITDTDGLPGATGPASCARKELDDRTGTYSSYAVSAAAAAHTIAAPGTCITSAGIGGKTSTYTGTSQAAPHVAGAVALCHGSGGVPGPCAGLPPAAVVTRVRADATAALTLSTGFLGDPLRPLSGKVFGPLVSAAAY
jgi:subtilisin